MATKVTTLKNAEKTDNLLPRTELNAIFDSDGNYLDSNLKASDLNALKGGAVDELVRFTEDGAGTPIPIDADTLEGHDASYFATASAVTSLNTALTPTSQTVDYTSRLSTIYRSSCYLVGNMLNVNFNAMASSGTDPKIATLPFSLPTIIDFVIERADGSVSPAYAVGNEMFFNAPQPTSVGVLCNVWFPVIVPQT